MNDAQKNLFVQRLMFDPVSYIHPQRFQLPAYLALPRQRAIINQWLLQQYSLAVETSEMIKLSKQTQLLLQHWSQLPQIAFLLACQRLRAELARGGLLFKLPAWAKQFALLPLRDSAASGLSIKLSTVKIMAVGLSELLSWENDLPLWLRQRLLLLFSTESETLVHTASYVSASPDLALFLLAAQHAKSYYDPSFTTIA